MVENNNKVKYVSSKEIKRKFSISSQTLRRWSNNNVINSVRTPSNHRLFNLNEIDELILKNKSNEKKRKICYARVSSSHQKADLERQIQDLKSKYPDHEVISDIGSGLNFKKKGIESLIKSIINNEIEEVVITHKDRLCRFGFELIELIIEKFGVNLIVLNKSIDQTYEQELAEDLLSIVNIFVAKNNGRRSAENRKRRKDEQQENDSNKKSKNK